MPLPNNVELADALDTAANWLEANPTKHISKDLILSSEGYPTLYPRATHAECYCALGRLAYELNLEPVQRKGKRHSFPSLYKPLEDVLQPHGIYPADIYAVNDRQDDDYEHRVRVGKKMAVLGNPDVVPYLRNLANGLRS